MTWRCIECKLDVDSPAARCTECQEKLDEDKRRAALTEAERRYEDLHGSEALRRQQQAARDYLPCWGEHKDDGHHEACSKKPVDDLPAVIPGQETLA